MHLSRIVDYSSNSRQSNTFTQTRPGRTVSPIIPSSSSSSEHSQTPLISPAPETDQMERHDIPALKDTSQISLSAGVGRAGTYYVGQSSPQSRPQQYLSRHTFSSYPFPAVHTPSAELAGLSFEPGTPSTVHRPETLHGATQLLPSSAPTTPHYGHPAFSEVALLAAVASAASRLETKPDNDIETRDPPTFNRGHQVQLSEQPRGGILARRLQKSKRDGDVKTPLSPAENMPRILHSKKRGSLRYHRFDDSESSTSQRRTESESSEEDSEENKRRMKPFSVSSKPLKFGRNRSFKQQLDHDQKMILKIPSRNPTTVNTPELGVQKSPYPLTNVDDITHGRERHISADQQQQGPSCMLEQGKLWREFNAVFNEMVVTRAGRNLFPVLGFRPFHLIPDGTYTMAVDFVLVDLRKYRYIKDGWTTVNEGSKIGRKVGKEKKKAWLEYNFDTKITSNGRELASIISAKGELPIRRHAYVHPDSPNTGEYWMREGVSFSKLKLTNIGITQGDDFDSLFSLESFHRYMPRIHILLHSATSRHAAVASTPFAVTERKQDLVATFRFEETQFIAVTHYQNPNVTRLKKNYNPHAKGSKEEQDENQEENNRMQKDLHYWQFRQRNGQIEEETLQKQNWLSDPHNNLYSDRWQLLSDHRHQADWKDKIAGNRKIFCCPYGNADFDGERSEVNAENRLIEEEGDSFGKGREASFPLVHERKFRRNEHGRDDHVT